MCQPCVKHVCFIGDVPVLTHGSQKDKARFRQWGPMINQNQKLRTVNYSAIMVFTPFSSSCLMLSMGAPESVIM